DVPIASVTRRDERWTALFDHWIALMSGVDPTDASTADYGNFRDTGENWPVKDGFGALVASFGRDEPVALTTPVEAIDWGGRRTGVRTRAGAIRARAVIVTVSTGVLASGVIRFEPALPAWKRDAIAALPMGRLNKVAIRFARDAFGVPPLYVHSDTGSTETMGFQLNPFGRALAIGYVGGRFSDSLERAGPAAMSAYAVERLKAMFGSSIGRLVRASLCTRWGRNRRTLGSYSAARPGEAARRALLATPLGDRLFFAGEAASPDSFATVHGAYLTGIVAAKAVARALRRRG
ncbi:MAG: flavin monoamine oxidase family protein, partial [Alphaproteobacteria bacterium]